MMKFSATSNLTPALILLLSGAAAAGSVPTAQSLENDSNNSTRLVGLDLSGNAVIVLTGKPIFESGPGLRIYQGDDPEQSSSASSEKFLLLGIHGSGLRGIHGSGLRETDDSDTQGIHGSGLRGIHGSGLRETDDSDTQGIHGSGLRGIHGSGLRGIHGSGLRETDDSDTQGIHGSGLRGIHGSGLRGIHGSGLRETDDSDTQGIHGSGLRGIHGSGLRGIHGSGLRETDDSDTQGIHGSGLRGIHGSGLRGIHGSGLRETDDSDTQGIHGSGLRGIHGSGLRSATVSRRVLGDSDYLMQSGVQLVALGPIGSIDSVSQKLTILGSGIALADNAVFARADQGEIHTFFLGDVSSDEERTASKSYVAVGGYFGPSGEPVAQAVLYISAGFVEGSSPVFIRGSVQKVETAYGRGSIATTTVNWSATMYDPGLQQIEPGRSVEFSGVSFGNTVFANAARLLDNDVSELRGIHGSGLRETGDSDTQGIHGSGLRGIHGSGLRGIHGSGLRDTSGNRASQ